MQKYLNWVILLRYTLKRVSCIFFLFLPLFVLFSEKVNIDLLSSYFKLDCKYDESKNLIVISNADKNIELLYGSPFAKVNGKYIFLDDILMNYENKLSIDEEAFRKILLELSDDDAIYSFSDGEIVQEKISDKNATKIPNDNYIYTVKPEKILINAIVIDAGHGGEDPGTYRGSVIEKDIVLKVALKLEDKLKTLYPAKKVIMTRRKDLFVPLEKRAQIANNTLRKYGQTIFISIHVNASISPKPYGFETWYIVDNFKRNIIEKGVVTNDRDVENILNLMANDEVYTESKLLAVKIQQALEDKIGNVSKNRGVKENTYIVVKNSIMPAVLVEIGFLSNNYEAKRLTNDSYLNSITSAIIKGMSEFIHDYETISGCVR